jgi:hypothetical protein
MYTPITSEITIEIGTVLREISTGRLFLVTERLKPETDVSGEDIWRITSKVRESFDNEVVLTRQQLSEKYFAEVGE